MRHAPARPLGRSRLWGRGCACRCPLWALFVVGGVLVAGVVAGWSLAFVGQSFVGRWPLLSSVRAVIELWGGGGSFVARVCLWWWELRDVACGRQVVLWAKLRHLASPRLATWRSPGGDQKFPERGGETWRFTPTIQVKFGLSNVLGSQFSLGKSSKSLSAEIQQFRFIEVAFQLTKA